MTRLQLWAAILAVGATPATAGTPAAGAPPEPARADWELRHVEAPREIGLGTMAVNVWADVARSDAASAIESCTLVFRDDHGNETTVDMTPTDGTFDGADEEVVGTVDTYTWVKDGAHPWEIRAVSPGETPFVIARGAIRVKPRVTTPDLMLLDAHGVVHPWVGSGAGGFTPGEPLDAGMPGAPPRVVDANRDGLPDLCVPMRNGTVRILENHGNGKLIAGKSIACGPDLVACATGDLDGDGADDLVTVGAGGLLEVHLGLAASSDAALPLRLVPECVEVADLDGDGKGEIYVGLLGSTSGEVHVIRRDATGNWADVRVLSPPAGGRGRVRRLSRVPGPPKRGDELLVLASREGEGTLESWGRLADTQTEPGLRTGVRFAGEPTDVVSGRFLGSGAPLTRLVLVRQEHGVDLISIGPDDVPRRVGTIDTVPDGVAALDLDGDGDDDLATAAEDLRLWINLGGRGFREAGESPYILETPVIALASGSLDERLPE